MLLIQRVLILLLLLPIVLGAQEFRDGLALGHWKSHLPYRAGISVTQSPTKVYFASQEAIFSVDKEEHAVELFNKVSGLSETRIRTINFNQDLEVLVIGYENSNIDLLYEDGDIININEIKRKSITGDKLIYHINFDNTSAWFSCGFGIVQMDLTVPETRSTTFTPYPTYGIEIFNDYIYVTTSNGIYRVQHNNSSVNIQDFSVWEKIGTAQGMPFNNYPASAIESLNGKLYASSGKEVYVFDGNSWSFHFSYNNYEYESFEQADGFLLGNTKNPGGQDRIVKIYPDGNGNVIWDNLAADFPKAIQDEKKNVWIADNFKGFGYIETSFEEKTFNVEGPYHINCADLYMHNEELWVASAYLAPKYNPKANSSGFYSFIEENWEVVRPYQYEKLNTVRDINVVAVHPETNDVYGGSFGKGLIEYNRDTIKVFDGSNSSLSDSPLAPGSYRVTGLAFDSENNLWVANYSAPIPISVFTADRQWQAIVLPFTINDITKVVVDNSGYKWFATKSNGVVVYDSGSDLLSQTDDRFARINTNNSELKSNSIQSIAVDRDGDVWVGTSTGIAVFECINQLFDDGCAGRRPVSEEGGIDENLLKDEQVNAITIDGANRKWLGTTSGVFVIDDNEKTVHSFNEDNSPLFSNNVIDIAINQTCGEVFISTENGIISYKNRAIAGKPSMDKNNVLVYPNPVRQDFEGDIAIKGLVEDSDIKITDVAGALIYETTALGGQAVWNGQDYNGRKANTGVYLVFAAGDNGTQKVVTKILVIN